MRSITFVVAGAFDTRTGGSIYQRRLVENLRRRGWSIDVYELDASFPFPTHEALRHAGDVLDEMATGRVVVIDGLAFGAMPELVRAAAPRLRFVAVVHLPLAAAVGLTPDQVARLRVSEQLAIASAALLVITGPSTRALMAEHSLSHPCVAVVEPGTDRAPLGRGSGSPDLEILTVATLNAGKGHELLIEALAPLRDRAWRLTCAGSLTRDPVTADRVRQLVARLDLGSRVHLAGELQEDELDAQYHRADIFVSASLRETFGMAVAEALARGIPVVGTATGEAPALLGGNAGSVVPVGDRAALRAALARMIDDGEWRARCAAGARRVRESLPTWDQAAERFAAAIGRIDADG